MRVRKLLVRSRHGFLGLCGFGLGKHVLDVLRLVLRLVLLRRLFVGQLDGPRPIEELGGAVCGGVLLELGAGVGAHALAYVVAAYALGAVAGFEHSVREDFAVEES